MLELNLKILEQLADAVKARGARLIVADASRYFEPGSSELAGQLEKLCEEQTLGYVSLSAALLDANARRVATSWPRDGHFNRAGNELFADVLFRWLVAHGRKPA